MSHKLTDAQWKRVSEDYARMYFALARISKFMSVETVLKNAEKLYGLEPHEALEMAYENVLAEARVGLRAVRKKFPANNAGSN